MRQGALSSQAIFAYYLAHLRGGEIAFLVTHITLVFSFFSSSRKSTRFSSTSVFGECESRSFRFVGINSGYSTTVRSVAFHFFIAQKPAKSFNLRVAPEMEPIQRPFETEVHVHVCTCMYVYFCMFVYSISVCVACLCEMDEACSRMCVTHWPKIIFPIPVILLKTSSIP